MFTKLFIFNILVLIILGTVIEGSPHRWLHHGQNRYYQQPPFQKYSQQNIGVAQENIEWVCTNPKTKDMMVIASENVPVRLGGQDQWSQANYPQPQPPVNNQPIYIQPNYPESQPLPNEQSYPSASPNLVKRTSEAPGGVWYETTAKPPQPTQGPPNTNGEGLIDIRVGN